MGLINDLFHPVASEHVRMDVSEVTPQLYLGTNQCCREHFKVLLIERGVLHDISLEGEEIDAPFGVETFLWLPTSDHTSPTQMDLRLGVGYLSNVIAMNGKVYVHCKNGHGRAPTLVAAWFISQGKSVDEAVELVRQKRVEIHIEPTQMEALRIFFHDSRA
jgi:protein-tyrosine phosphatase